MPPRLRAQAGFTLIELLVATALGVIVMTALTSVVLTTYRADQVATSRVEASGEIRNFQQAAYDDFASSSLPSVPSGCGTARQPCTLDPVTLNGCALNSLSGAPHKQTVSYAWNRSTGVIERTVNSIAVNPAAGSVSGFAWYVDGTAPNQSVVISLTVTVHSITQSQTMRFYPRVVSQLPALVSAPC